ncbi:HAD-IA family hydrolase [Simiduia sp. 21SJ11W-1]|uniref:HAD-IA family hydrolase n=1 Tax=Simiduia sp. 21SJ11W-1 TaxID=2909669 RepID=UPI00209F1247|nr:HAD-IA family hydrolase [Simiduia sp. 21SJ11W-1]UTA46348.1 HAD-IA family hydrolase [Simiduia sp. 21SJ11W-1]
MLVIFDWDGTLSDSTGKIVRCVQAAARATGLPVLPAIEVQQIIGLALEEALHRLYPTVSVAERTRLTRAYVDAFVAADATPSEFFCGVEAGLQSLRERGLKLAVATGKSRRGLDRVLANLGMTDFFDATRCADETAGKPDPKMLHELLSYFGVPGEAAVMVGDTTYDMAMAQAAGMRRVAVTYGAHSPAQLTPYKPELLADSFADFMGWSERADALVAGGMVSD